MATRSQSSPQSRAETEPEFVPVERAPNVLDLIGNTPLLEITRLTEGIIAPAVRIFAKLEGFNPGGSVKDRAARSMILRGIESGELTARQNRSSIRPRATPASRLRWSGRRSVIRSSW